MSLEQVKEFHKTFGHPIEEKPVIPSKDRCELRINLIQEELNELKLALEENNVIEVGDALTDLQYVLSGAVLEFGFSSLVERMNNEVHRSNMSKACDTDEEGKASLKALEDKGVNCHFRIINNKRVIQRAEDDKVLKSLFYSPPKLDFILNE